MNNFDKSLFILFLCATWSLGARGADTPQSADAMFKECSVSLSTAEQRDCLPLVLKKSEAELVSAEKKERASMAELEKISEGSRKLRPVRAFDRAAKAFRAYRDSECNRVLTSYGSGNGGGIAFWECKIKMNLERASKLNSERNN